MTVMPRRNRPTPPRTEIAVDTHAPSACRDSHLRHPLPGCCRVKPRQDDRGRSQIPSCRALDTNVDGLDDGSDYESSQSREPPCRKESAALRPPGAEPTVLNPVSEVGSRSGCCSRRE